MKEILTWFSNQDWTQFIPDVLAAILTGLFVAFAIRWSDRRAEKLRAQKVAEAELSPLAGTLEVELADGVIFETLGNSGAAGLIPSGQFRERLKEATKLQRYLSPRCAKEYKHTILLFHVVTHLDTMLREGHLLEQSLALEIRQVSELSIDEVEGEVNRLREAIQQPEADLGSLSRSYPFIFGDDDETKPLQWHVRSYLHSRKLAELASVAYRDYCVDSRWIAHVQTLEDISHGEERKVLRKEKDDSRRLRDQNLENTIAELQEAMGGC